MLGRMMSSGSLSADQTTAVMIVLAALSAVVLIAVPGIMFGTWAAVAKARADAALKRQMVDRGMSADEIVRVVTACGGGAVRVAGAVDLPCACEAVVRDDDGDWCPALILQAGDGRYLVHYVGQDMDDNEWVGGDRVRLPAGSPLPELAARSHNYPGSNGTPGKPPVEAEV
jgi:hypothetical protein